MRKISEKIFKTNTGEYKFRIISRDKNGYTLEFLTGPKAGEFTITERSLANIHKGNIKNPYHPYVLGVGYLGEVNYIEKDVYNFWYEMIRRCYYGKNKAYRHVSVSDEFLCFKNFQNWSKSQSNFNSNLELDKDLKTLGLIKCDLYSSSNCLYIPRLINSFLKRRDGDRGNEVIGVRKYKNSYICRVSICNQRLQFYFKTELDAFIFYRGLKKFALESMVHQYSSVVNDEIRKFAMNYVFIDETGKFTEEYINSNIINEEEYCRVLRPDFDSICREITSIINKYKSDEMCVQRLSKAIKQR